VTHLFQPIPNLDDFSINHITELPTGNIVCIAENPGLGKRVLIMDPKKSLYFIQPRPFKKFRINFMSRVNGLIAVGGKKEGASVVYFYELVKKISKFKSFIPWFFDFDMNNIYTWKLRIIKKIKIRGDPLKLLSLDHGKFLLISSGVNFNYFSIYDRNYELEKILKINREDYYGFKYSSGVFMILSKTEKEIKAFQMNKNFTLFQKLNHKGEDIRFMTILHNRLLLSVSSNGFSKLWKYRNETFIQLDEFYLDTHGSFITSLLLLKNGCLVVGLENGIIKIYNPYEKFKLLHNLNSGSPYPVTCLYQIRMGRILSGDEKGEIRVWAHFSLMKNFKRFYIEYQIYYFYLIILTTIIYCDLI
jgi:WD40 repeat protein